MKQITVNIENFKLREFLEYSEKNIDEVGVTYGVLFIDELGDSPNIDVDLNTIDEYIEALDSKLIYLPFAYTSDPDEEPISCLSGEKIEYDEDLDIGKFEFSMTTEAAILLRKEGDNLIINSADSCGDMFGGSAIVENGGIIDDIMEKYIESYII